MCIVCGMSLGTVLLGVLVDGPAHGYDLKRSHDARFPGSRQLAFGQVYSSLSRLQRDGLVEVASTEQESGPERTVYALTDAGVAALLAWLGEVESPANYSADELVRKTVTALHAGVDAEEYLVSQRQAHMDSLRELVRRRASLNGAARVGEQIALDHTIAHLDADLRWLEESRQRVADYRRSGK